LLTFKIVKAKRNTRLIEEAITSLYRVKIIGRTDKIKDRYSAISLERRLKHPADMGIIDAIKKTELKAFTVPGKYLLL